MNERELILALRQGSYDSFRALYDRWVSALYKYVFGLVKSEAMTEDIVQNTFIKAWDNRANINPDYSFKAYLFTISYHDVVSEFRRQVRNPLMDEFFAYNYSSPSDKGADDVLQYDEFVARLNKAKEKLTARQREIFELRYEYDKKPREIEQMLNINTQTVRNTLASALKIVRKELKTYTLLLALFCTL